MRRCRPGARSLGFRVAPDSFAYTLSNGLATLPARHFDGVPFLLTEHGIYLRERYLGSLRDTQRWPVKAFMLGFHRALNTLGYRAADLITLQPVQPPLGGARRRPARQDPHAALTLLKNDEQRLKLGESARRRVIARFTLRRSVDNFRTIYQELAGLPEVYEPTLETVADWTRELRDPWYRAVATDGTGW